MNDRDTAKAAADDLMSILYNMDQESLPIILSCLCTTGSEHKVYARKECARALGVICSEACPLRDQALQPPHLAKVLAQLRRSLQDADSGVREASVETLALVARGLAEVGPGGCGGSASNPVLRLLFDCLAEQKKDLNAAACAALGLAAPHLGTLEPQLARELVRKLNAPSFQAPAPLLAALARTDPATGEPVGLIRSGPAAFVPLMPTLLGQPPQPASASGNASGSAAGGGGSVGSGAVGALCRPEWSVRLAAADLLRATAMLLGPLMEADGCWAAADPRCLTGRALRGLEARRFDKVREVRDVARGALAVYEELHAYGSAGGSAAGWPAHIAERLLARGLPVPGPPVSPSPANPDPTLNPSPAPAPAPGRAPSAPPGRKSPLRRSSPGPSAAALAGRRRASPSPPPEPEPGRRPSPLALRRDSSLAERFRAAHRSGEIAVHDPLGPVDFAAMETAEAEARAAEEGAVAGGEVAAAPAGAGAAVDGGDGAETSRHEAESPAAAWLAAGCRAQGEAAANGGSGPTSRGTSRQTSRAASGNGRGPGADEGRILTSQFSQFSVASVASTDGPGRQLQPEKPAAPCIPSDGQAQPQLQKPGDDGAPPGEEDDLPLTWGGEDGPPTFAQQISDAARAIGLSPEAGSSSHPGVNPAANPAPANPAAAPSLPSHDSRNSSRPSGPPSAPVPAWPAGSATAPAASSSSLADEGPARAAASGASSAAVPAGPGQAPAAAESQVSGGVALPTVDEWLAAQEQLRGLEARQRELLESFAALSEQSSAAISGLQAKVRGLEEALGAANAHIRVLTATQPPVQLPHHRQPPQQPSPSQQPLHLQPPASSQQQQQQQQPLPPPLQQQQQPQQQQPSPAQQRQPHRQQGRAPPAAAPPRDQGDPQPSAEAPESSQAPSLLMRTIKPGSPLSLALALGGGPAVGSVAEAASPRVTVQLPPTSPAFRSAQPDASGGAPASSRGDAHSDARQAYREVLSGGRPGEMQLLRLMQRTGPVWNELGHELSCQLLAAFTTSVQLVRAESSMLMLSRILPWLWRLADDEHNRFEAPLEMRAALMAALRAAQPSVTDDTLHERMALLINTLHTHWSLPAPDPWDTRRSVAQPAEAPAPLLYTPSTRPAVPSPSPQSAGPAPQYPAPSPSVAGDASSGSAIGGAVAALPHPSSLPHNDGISRDGREATDVMARVASSEPVWGSPDPDQQQEPAKETPPVGRMGGALLALAAPSFNTLVGQWNDLQLGFADFKAGPAKPPAR